MRVRVDVEADVRSLSWSDVHGPARGVVYGLLSSHDADLARRLHDEGWNGQSLKPLGMTSPQFRGARRVKGVYTTSADGSVWFGSPAPELAAALVSSLSKRTEIRWGAARLRVRGVALDVTTPSPSGPVELATLTPVIVKGENGYLLPEDELYLDRLRHNLAHKASVLGLPAPTGVRVLEAGPRRKFTVRGAPRIGALVRVSMDADGRFVDALRSWGLGLDTMQGFGWIK
ncbi:CRISPR-associated endoribonuclease Cas6 [Streptomyces sp. NPDC049906]|uniref:CRISPR-associated endoribonuclease Cas6 n=1 Tax=Streptomyces sp. NPDC049906 TaxID=3155656 RepID=UPI003444664D